MTTHGQVRPVVMAATIAMIVLAGCGSSHSSGNLKSTAPAVTASAAGAPTTVAPATLQSATNPKLGAILTDTAGMTLYRNTKEQGGTIACTGGCTSVWSPLLMAAGSSLPTAGAGVAGTIASVMRPDGGTQVTYNGAPLYHYAGDHQAGDTAGQGVAGIWFVVSPTAVASTTPPTTVAPATHTTVAPARTAPTSPPMTPAPTTPKPSPTTPPTSPPAPRPTTPPPTMPPPTTCLYPPCY